MPVNGKGRCAYDDLRDAGRLRVIKRKLLLGTDPSTVHSFFSSGVDCVTVTDLVGRLMVQTRDHLTGPRIDDGLDIHTRQMLVGITADYCRERLWRILNQTPGNPICRVTDLATNSTVSSPRIISTSPTSSRKVSLAVVMYSEYNRLFVDSHNEHGQAHLGICLTQDSNS